ncbi:MAG: FecR domain-containing protein [Pikeienuella sp.]|uniref:FecR family protein n=1 Tax=Pikeienuella sp. TaxID=2831957 RepID=UPI00391A497A
MSIKRNFIAAAAVAALCAGGAGAAELAGRAVAVQQDALQAEGAVGFPIDAGAEIFRNARVYTKQYGTAEIRLEDGTALTVAPNASLVIDDYVFAGAGRPGSLALSLSRGAMRMVSGRMPKEGVAVSTSIGTIGVRGTDFWIEAPSDDLIRLWVLEGVVTAAPANSATVFEFTAPAFATCSAGGCEPGEAPPVPVTNPLGGEAGGAGDPGIDAEESHESPSDF